VITELGGPVFEFTHDLIGDLFSAKNAGVTPPCLLPQRVPRLAAAKPRFAADKPRFARNPAGKPLPPFLT
jgi:hypothetical protein